MTSFFVKYGKKEHLEQIINGKIRFAPAITYMKTEAEHDKGQGDLLEGKLKIHANKSTLFNNKATMQNENVTYVISIQDVSNMPVFCLSKYGHESIVEEFGNIYISISHEHLRGIEKDFKEATYALIILQPEIFIRDVTNISNKRIYSDNIHYFDYSQNEIDRFRYLATGNTNIRLNNTPLTVKKRYRHLFCKDVFFKNQKEYRFISVDEKVEEAVFYDFTFNSKYKLLPVRCLYGKINCYD